jgi:hypothetical protein
MVRACELGHPDPVLRLGVDVGHGSLAEGSTMTRDREALLLGLIAWGLLVIGLCVTFPTVWH